MSDLPNTIPNVPPPTNTPPSSTPRILAILGALFGGLILLLSLCGILAYFIAPRNGGVDALGNNTVLGSVIALGLIFGGLALSIALTVLRHRPQPRFHLPPWWLFVVLFFIAIGLGQFVLTTNVGTPYLFPPWHVLASAMLPLAALAYAARRLPAASNPSIVAEFTWGGVGTVLLAAVLELIIGAFLILAIVLVLALVLGSTGFEQLVAQFRGLLNGPRGLTRIDEFMRLVMQQPALLITVGLAAIVMLSLFVPLVEETLKSLGPAIAIGMTKPSLTRALLWGIAAGAGYAFSENLFNGAVGLSPQAGAAGTWALPMMLRGGTSFVHIATTATVSVGWYSALVLKRRARFLLYFIAALAAHGFWNFISVVLSTVVAGTGTSGGLGNLSGLSALLSAVELAILLVLVFAAAMWIVWLVKWAQRQEATLNQIS